LTWRRSEKITSHGGLEVGPLFLFGIGFALVLLCEKLRDSKESPEHSQRWPFCSKELLELAFFYALAQFSAWQLLISGIVRYFMPVYLTPATSLNPFARRMHCPDE
jgi:hypothetical protein